MGWGSFSPISYVLLANIPDQLQTATVTNDGIYINIEWQITPNNRNSPVFAYLIMIQRSDGTYV